MGRADTDLTSEQATFYIYEKKLRDDLQESNCDELQEKRREEL
jgi:hypothetical protein